LNPRRFPYTECSAKAEALTVRHNQLDWMLVLVCFKTELKATDLGHLACDWVLLKKKFLFEPASFRVKAKRSNYIDNPYFEECQSVVIL
jgi:hypothetical protein